ncbi:MAG: LysR family transcriptional regulator [Proteobacteria bacterium]|nr:LysR family transcriptional regulator [Pseudomonadota bacterium]
MDRVQRLSSLWNWLPVFRAVAEVENLPAASKALNISASALSRTVRLLEEDLGHDLFDRVGRRLVLNDKGGALLAGLRDAMRIICDAIDEVNSALMKGPVRLAAPGSFMPIVILPALRLLKQRHPDLRPILASVSPSQLAEQLIHGTLDLALTDQEIRLGDELAAELLFRASYGVYCGAGHPLYDRDDSEIDLSEIQRYEFTAPPGMVDHWPVHLDRTVAVQSTLLSIGVELCGSGDFLAVLPDMIARVPRSFGSLRRLPFEVCPPVPMYLLYRQSASQSSPTRAALAAIRDSLAA